jgi:ABC-2 type transport system permease protein
MRRRLLAIVRKEFIHILRDFRSLMIILLMPILMIVLYGYGITLDMRNIRFTVIDQSNTPESRDLVRAFSDNGFFLLVPKRISPSEVEHLFRRREVGMVLVIPQDFARSLASSPVTKVQVLVDASDSNVGTFIGNYSSQVLRLFNQRRGAAPPAMVNFEPRIMYNPDMKSAYFFVPGLVALLLILISALLTSITITREKESGTMEQILVSPIHPMEIVVGKVLPYVTIGFVIGALILVFARIIFDVPMRGSLLLLAAQSTLYIFVSLSFGLLISTVSTTQMDAMFRTVMATILPTFMLSGFLFPIASMPLPLQFIAKALPATYFLVIIRGVMLKGVGLSELWPQTLILAGIGVFILAVSIRRFKMRLD